MSDNNPYAAVRSSSFSASRNWRERGYEPWSLTRRESRRAMGAREKEEEEEEDES